MKHEEMNALQKAKFALRKFLLENREQVVADLDSMRKMSEGKDIFNYIENVSDAFSFECVTSSTEMIIDFSFQDIECYNLLDEMIDNLFYLPPNKASKGTKKRSEISSERFFYNFAE